MTLSLSPRFRSCFRSSLFFLLLSLKFLLVLKSVNGFSMQFKECLKFDGSFKEVLRVLQGCLKEVSWMFKGSFKDV